MNCKHELRCITIYFVFSNNQIKWKTTADETQATTEWKKIHRVNKSQFYSWKRTLDSTNKLLRTWRRLCLTKRSCNYLFIRFSLLWQRRSVVFRKNQGFDGRCRKTHFRRCYRPKQFPYSSIIRVTSERYSAYLLIGNTEAAFFKFGRSLLLMTSQVIITKERFCMLEVRNSTKTRKILMAGF